MAFEGGWINSEEDKKYVESKGFTYITGNPMTDQKLWAIDRERDIILVPRGGGGLEIPESYSLFIDGQIVNMEATKKTEGNQLKNDLKIFYNIHKIEVAEAWRDKGYTETELKKIIVEAFKGYGGYGFKPSQISEVVVNISSDIKMN